MSYDVKNGQLQPKQVQVNVTPQQMAALVLMERRIGDLNADAQVLVGLGCPALAAAVEKATIDMSKVHDAFIAELSKAVKLASPADVPTGPVLVRP